MLILLDVEIARILLDRRITELGLGDPKLVLLKGRVGDEFIYRELESMLALRNS